MMMIVVQRNSLASGFNLKGDVHEIKSGNRVELINLGGRERGKVPSGLEPTSGKLRGYLLHDIDPRG